MHCCYPFTYCNLAKRTVATVSWEFLAPSNAYWTACMWQESQKDFSSPAVHLCWQSFQVTALTYLQAV